MQHKIKEKKCETIMNYKEMYIKSLNLSPHPEGGWYRQIYHSDDQIYDSASKDKRYNYTSIYFMLDGTSPSHFHKLTHDELWYYHDGSPLTIHCISEDGEYYKNDLGKDIANGQHLQLKVPKNTVFASEVTSPTDFGLVSCVVSPGFDFRDFSLVSKHQILSMNNSDNVKKIVDRLTIN